MLPLPHNFTHPPWCYYRLQKIGTHGLRIAFDGITSVQSFVTIIAMVQKLKSDTQHSDLVNLDIFMRLESRRKMTEVESKYPFACL
jgi:hypothetical protein